MDGSPRAPESSVPSRFRPHLTLILILDAALVLPFLGRLTLWNVDEGRISEVSREMALSGDWVVPRLGEQVFSCYPPLTYWLMATSGRLLGFNEFSMRLPNALAGIALVAVVGIMTRRLAGDRAGLTAAAILATLPGFFVQESMCRADVLTMFFATFAFDRFLAWAEGPRRGRDLALMYFSAALGVLAKGPISVVTLGLGGLAWFLIRGRWRLLLEMKLWIGVPAALALALPWYVLVYQRAGVGFLQQNLLLENVSAFTTGYQQKRPVWFYFGAVPAVTMPWLLALTLSWKVRRAPGLTLALGWLVGIFLFLTISSAKRQSYVTYLDPPLAMAAGITLAALASEAPRLVKRALMGLSGFMAGGAGALALVPPARWTAERMQLLTDLLPLLAGLIAGGAALLFGVAWRRGPVPAMATLALLLAAGIALYASKISPRFEQEGRDGVAFCRRIAQAVPAGERIAVLGPEELDGAYQFYADRPLPTRNGEPGYYVVTSAQRDRLVAAGKKVAIKDLVRDARRRDTFFLQVIE